MALNSRYAVTVSAAVATHPRAYCSSMEDRRGNKRPYQPKYSPSQSFRASAALGKPAALIHDCSCQLPLLFHIPSPNVPSGLCLI